MSPSLIFQFAVRVFTPIMLLFSLVVYWRGHQLPGGGFIGGLVAGIALSLHALCYGAEETIRKFRVSPLVILFLGLLVALLSALWGGLMGAAFFTGQWAELPVIGKVGTPMLFDLGVYLVVLGSVCTTLFHLMEEEK